MRSELRKLKDVSSFYEFAELLNFEPENLYNILYKLPPEKKYYKFIIPKKSGGGVREINAPCRELKKAQNKLAEILYSCVDEIGSEQKPRRKPLSHGFKKKAKIGSNGKGEYLTLGIHTNAKCHRHKRYVLNLDLADFFPSFNFPRVRGFFIKNKNFELNPKIATLIAQLACHENELPQGSPCSPIISNLITHILDVRLTRLAKKYGCTYSRYADDMTFSTKKKIRPEEINKLSEGTNQWFVESEIESIIERSGFKINPAKTRLQSWQSRQVVTGLVVNKKVNIKSEYYRYARAQCHSLFTKGTFFLPGTDKPATLQQLEGILNHIHFIKEYGLTEKELSDRQLIIDSTKGKKPPKRNAATELYSRFLYFSYFVALEKPLIMCEGKTDAIYLKAAITQQKKKDISNFKHDVNFFPHSHRTREVMRIHDGVQALKNFIEFYAERTKFTFAPLKHPVILLLDNDNEAQGAISLVSEKFKKEGIEYDRQIRFTYPVISNLYLVLLPKHGDKEVNKIEDFFNQEATETELNGKTFSPENGGKFDNKKHYSKQVLAEKIVKPRQNDLDFSKFQPILEEISGAIEDWDRKKYGIN